MITNSRIQSIERYLESIDTSNRHQFGDDTVHSNKRSASKNAIISEPEIVAVDSEQKESVKVVLQSDFGRVLCEFKVSDSSVLTECASEPVVDPVVQYKAGQPLQPPVIDTLEQIVVRKWRAPNRRAPIIKNSENPPIDAPDSIFKHSPSQRPPAPRPPGEGRKKSKKRKRSEFELGSDLNVEGVRELEMSKDVDFENEIANEIYQKMTLLYSTMRVELPCLLLA